MSLVLDEIRTFNKDLKPIGQPYWLTPEENRANQRAGSIVVAFATEIEATKAIRHRVYIGGISAKAEKLYSTAPSSQCSKCQGFGHLESHCRKTPKCQLCGENHASAVHQCNTCHIKGKKCLHLVPKCANCKESHTADFKSCEILKAIKRRSPRPSNTQSTSMEL
jgi:hypothetical protein